MRRLPFLLLILTTACAGGTKPPATSPITETGIVGGHVEMSIVAGAAVPPVLVSVAGTALRMRVRVTGRVSAGGLTAREIAVR